MIDKAFWKGKRVFLTGHTGFKGSWMTFWLTQMEAQVFGYSLDPEGKENLCDYLKLSSRVEGDTRADIRDYVKLKGALAQAQPEIVFHLAAQPLVRTSYEDPLGTYSTNVMGTANLLEAARTVPTIKAIVIITTDKCYENKEWYWGYREDEPMGGYDPYSNSKACAELVTSAFRNSFFNPKDYALHGVGVASARAGNVIGGGDYAKDRLIPDILRAIKNNEKVKIRNPHAIRPWQHVLEPISGYLALGQKLFFDPIYAQAYNFGPRDEDAKEVQWIVDKLTSLWPGSRGYEIQGGEHLHEAKFLKLDTSKAKAELGWHPVWNLSTTLEKIVEWERTPLDRKVEICKKQIEEYIGFPL